MRDIAEKLKLKGLAEEDIYFARRDRELIEALRRKKLEEHAKCTNKKGVDKAAAYQEEFDEITRKHSKKTQAPPQVVPEANRQNPEKMPSELSFAALCPDYGWCGQPPIFETVSSGFPPPPV